MIELRRLTESGRRSFIEYLQRVRTGSTEQPPILQLSCEPFSTEFVPGVQVDETRIFSTRYQMGEYLNSLFTAIDRGSLLADRGIWDWLSLIWFNQVCPSNEQNQRKIGETARYVVSSDRTDYYRHLVRGAWDIYSLHEVHSRLLLDCPPYVLGDWTEQLASRQDIIANRALIEATGRLYWDGRRQRPKTGASDRNRPGNVRRLVRVIQQLDLTYDLYAMSPDEILSLLPREFDVWKRR